MCVLPEEGVEVKSVGTPSCNNGMMSRNAEVAAEVATCCMEVVVVTGVARSRMVSAMRAIRGVKSDGVRHNEEDSCISTAGVSARSEGKFPHDQDSTKWLTKVDSLGFSGREQPSIDDRPFECDTSIIPD